MKLGNTNVYFLPPPPAMIIGGTSHKKKSIDAGDDNTKQREYSNLQNDRYK
jgi:hypothetical protein